LNATHTHRITADFPHTRYPHAKVSKRAALSFIWAVPAIAAIVAVVLVIQNLQKFGPAITIQFDNASGLDANQTVVRYRGIRVGSVSSIALSPDLQHVQVQARLYRSAAGLAKEGSIFWIVRPEVGAAGVHALETIVSGPYIEALPGDNAGKIQKNFVGASEPPVIKQANGGVEFVLHATQIRSLGADSPVYFRGLQAGKVEYLDLSEDSKIVNVHVLLKPNFAALVRANTVWWNAGGIDVNWHLLFHLNMSAENLKSVLTGGISFATPNKPEGPAPAGATFVLNERPDDKWLEWSPYVDVTNATVSAKGNSGGVDMESVNQIQNQVQKQQ
jgi:paraquat-inducible protein B